MRDDRRRNATYSAIMEDVSTYVDEMSLKFILGIEPMDSFDAYVEQLLALDVDEAIAIQQSALDRYNESIRP